MTPEPSWSDLIRDTPLPAMTEAYDKMIEATLARDEEAYREAKREFWKARKP